MNWLYMLCATLTWQLVSPAHTFAECPTVTSSAPGATCVRDVMMHGERGTWWNQDNVEKILFTMRAYPELQLQVEKFALADNLWRQENMVLRQAVQAQRDIQANTQKQLNLAATDAQRAREALDAKSGFWRSPVFWGISMFLVGAIAQNIYIQSTR